MKWPDSLAVGSVIKSKKGRTFRAVRKVTYKHDGRIWGVHLSIRRCSWTKRCYTIYTRNDLIQFFRPTSMKVKIGSRIDSKILKNMSDPHVRTLDCCDVKGID